MLAEEIISKAIPPVNNSATVKNVLSLLAEFKLTHLPVVNNGQFLGLLIEDELTNIKDQESTIAENSLSFIHAFVFNHVHIYDVVRLLAELNLSSVAVLDQHKNYLGLISANHILSPLASQFAINQPGGIIVLEIGNRDNSLSHMAQIVEADNAQILSSSVTSFPDSTRLEVTLKVNKTDITGLVASFERYNYQVKEVFNNTQIDNGSQERYDSFMNYLNV